VAKTKSSCRQLNTTRPALDSEGISRRMKGCNREICNMLRGRELSSDRSDAECC